MPDEELIGRLSEKDRRTSGDNSASTWRARRAADARRWVGKGTEMTLGKLVLRSPRGRGGLDGQGARKTRVYVVVYPNHRNP